MRYIVGFIVFIVLLILLIVLLFGGGGNKQQVPGTSKPLTSYIDQDSSVRLTIDGPVNAESIHQQERITVSSQSVIYELLQGYAENTEQQKSFANDPQNYDVFLNSLERAGFTQGNTDEKLKNEKGFCALGKRYIYELIVGGETKERFWSTSCNKTRTYNGNINLTLDLFRNQVPPAGQGGVNLQLL